MVRESILVKFSKLHLIRDEPVREFFVHCTYRIIERRAVKILTSLRISAVSPEPSFLAYTKNGGKEGLMPKIRLPTPLDTPARVFIRGFGAYAIRAKISCAGP